MVTYFFYNSIRNASVCSSILASKALPLAGFGERISNFNQNQGGQV